jgi:L,D-transpeptidase-like protein
MKKTNLLTIILLSTIICLAGPLLTLAVPAGLAAAQQSQPPAVPSDQDYDGLNDWDEINTFHTDITKFDTDGDGFGDGDEFINDYDPNSFFRDKLIRRLEVNLTNQTLTYFIGPYGFKTIKISSGVRWHSTPTGTFTIDKKLDEVLYKGVDYYYPHTKWNMRFKLSSLGNYYIHGAYWHNHFGHPASHGCVNVSYSDMEPLYNWTPTGTQVTIKY